MGKAKPPQQAAHGALGQVDIEAVRNHPGQVRPPPAHDAVPGQVGTFADQAGHLRLLLGRQARLRAGAALLVRQSRKPGGVVAMHPVAQRLPVHPAQPRRLRPRLAFLDQRQSEHPARGVAVPASRRLTTQLRRRVLIACDRNRCHQILLKSGGEPNHSAHGRGKAPGVNDLSRRHYISADHLVRAREQHSIDLTGPGRPRTGWQARVKDAYGSEDFFVDWEGQVARCPEGRTSTSWRAYHDMATGPYVRARFSAIDCNPCPSKPRCTRGREQGRQLTLPAREQHEALAAARARGDTKQGRQLHAQRQGIEGTISQGVRGFGMRRARYRGLVKTGLQNVATAAAINLDRLAAWFAERPLASTRISRFAAMAA